MSYGQIDHRFLSNQRAHRVLSILCALRLAITRKVNVAINLIALIAITVRDCQHFREPLRQPTLRSDCLNYPSIYTGQ